MDRPKLRCIVCGGPAFDCECWKVEKARRDMLEYGVRAIDAALAGDVGEVTAEIANVLRGNAAALQWLLDESFRVRNEAEGRSGRLS